MIGKAKRVRRRARAVAVVVTFLSVFAVGGASASAAMPWWHIASGSRPAYIEPEGEGSIFATVENVGDANFEGTVVPAQIVDTLPTGLRAAKAAAAVPYANLRHAIPCTIEAGGTRVSCSLAATVVPYAQVEVQIGVVAQEGSPLGVELNRVRVTGGGAPSAEIEHAVTISSLPTPFGVEDYELTNEEEGGALDTHAGSHPFQQTTTIDLNETASTSSIGRTPNSEPAGGQAKDLSFKWPAGLIGNPEVSPRCTAAQFAQTTKNAIDSTNACPASTAVGVVTLVVNEPSLFDAATFTVPLFNLEPAVGEPARFGFEVVEANAPVYIDTAVRTGGDYGITVTTHNITQTAGFLSAHVTVWGVPGDPRHDSQRGWGCLLAARGFANPSSCVRQEEAHPPAFLSLPTACAGPLHTNVEGDSWSSQGMFSSFEGALMPALSGCNRLPFESSIKVVPDGQAASTPTGLTVDVHIPQEESLNTNGLAESDVKDITVALPEGVAVNTAAADGLQACSEGLAGFTGLEESEPGSQTALFTPDLPSPLQPGTNFCPDGAKIATATIRTPILSHPIEGAVYLASQNVNPFGSLVAMYIVAQDPISGVLVKLAGEVQLSSTGQIVTTFKNNPQAPFEDAELHFFGGERAPLVTPDRCGTYTTNASVGPWSGNEAVSSSSSFQITSGPGGGPCPGAALPFSPSLTGGTTSIQAGGFSPFTMTMSREDGQQSLRAIALHMPPGISGLLSSVKLCGEAQANAGTCGPESEIGETIVSVGLGGDPFSVKGGKVFITEGYEGAPYGLSIVNPAKAGPFDLGQVIVRAKIEVDPITAALTVTSDSTGPYKIPTILDGIPLQIKHVNVTINRPGFTFNPTNCNPMSITGNLSSAEGANSNVSVPLQVTNCAVLGFKPGFKVATAGRTSRANGASLSVKLTYPKAPFGSQANIAKVKVDLPKQLPSRLTTLQKACPDSIFEANPALCSPQSRIGQAKATTPLLPVPLSGPAYFVSHGGAKFPELVIVLSGYGTTVQLHAETFISKAGITSSTFRTIPDVPVGTFELNLPQGKFSALAANGNLCKETLKMPTVFTAQNGAVIKQSTPIGVTGCQKTKKTKKAKRRSPSKRG
jgi:hypothetical protein